MSPRRRIEPGGRAVFAELPPAPRRRLGLALLLTVAAIAIIAAATVSTLLLLTHQRQHDAAVRNVAVTDFVRSFMTRYTSPDPFHANDYAQSVLDQSTGQLAKMYRDRINEIVIQVARAEPTQGSVLNTGVERWNDDGSANVVVATQTSTRLPDGTKVDSGIRWVATATQEGSQWKISNLIQVI